MRARSTYLLLLALACCREAPAQEESAPEPEATPEAAEPAEEAASAPETPPDATVPAIAWLPETVARFRAQAELAGRAHGVDPELLLIVALVESGGWVQAESPSGARGLMQIMPSTGRIIAAERGLGELDLDQLYDPAVSFDYGAWYLARQLERFGSADRDASVSLAAAAYNGGPTHLRRHLEDEEPLADQTVRYRRWVGEMWRQRHQTRSATFTEWLAAGGERLVARAAEEMRTAAKEAAKKALRAKKP